MIEAVIARSPNASMSCARSSSSRRSSSVATEHGGPLGLRASARISSSSDGLGDEDRAVIIHLPIPGSEERFGSGDRRHPPHLP